MRRMIINQRELLERITRSIVVEGKKFVNPEFIETNSSLIVLTGDKALKILKEKKNKQYSDLQSRFTWLYEEMRINSEITPKLYLNIRPIFLHHDQVIVGNDNNDLDSIVEYGLCMKRLKQASLVHNMLLNGTYSSKHSIIIARRIADFHISKLSGGLSQDDQILMQKFSSLATLKKVIKNDFETFEKRKANFVPTAITEFKYQRIKRYIFKFLEENENLLKERVSRGYVVPIHGDFHSTNIFVEGGSVYAIDRALSRNLRVNDIIKDPAYLSVDLETFGFEQEMECLLNTYQERVKDPCFEKLLPFYVCRLAFVKGIVSFSSGNQFQLKPYFDLAYKYAKQ